MWPQESLALLSWVRPPLGCQTWLSLPPLACHQGPSLSWQILTLPIKCSGCISRAACEKRGSLVDFSWVITRESLSPPWTCLASNHDHNYDQEKTRPLGSLCSISGFVETSAVSLGWVACALPPVFSKGSLSTQPREGGRSSFWCSIHQPTKPATN